MAEQTSQEPTMEEILASIRRIISEDETPEAEAKGTQPHGDEAPAIPAVEESAPAAVAAAPEPEAISAPAPQPALQPAPPPVLQPAPPPPVAAAAEEEGEEELELTEKVETLGDLDVYAPAEPPPAPPPLARPPMARPAPAAPGLVSDTAAAAAASAFGKLSAAVAMPVEGRTLEDVVRELLHPLLQQWLDDNLPAIVQQAVEAEVERIARGR